MTDTEAEKDDGGRITEEALQRLRDKIGEKKFARPAFEVISFDVARRFAQFCLVTSNPLFRDAEYGRNSCFGEAIPPPMAEIVTSSEDLANAGAGLPGVFGLHAGDHWTFGRRVKLGERLKAYGQLVDVETRPSKWGGEAVWQTFAFDYYDEQDQWVSRYSRQSVRAERRKTKEQGKYKPSKPYRYENEELERIWNGYDTEEIRGAKPRYIEDVSVGDDAGHVTKGPLLTMDMMAWWMGSGGPFMKAFGDRYAFIKKYPNYPLWDTEMNVPRSPEDAHFDTDFAHRSGVGAMYDIGRQRTAAMVHLSTNWMSDPGRLLEVKSNFRRPNYVGDTTWYQGTVSAVDTESSQVVIDIVATNQRGDVHADGKATIELPRRDTKASED
jgi:acyl dehydratase